MLKINIRLAYIIMQKITEQMRENGFTKVPKHITNGFI
jgi:hypothetical protein